MSYSNKKLKVFIPLLFTVVLVLGMFLGFKLRDKQGYNKALFSLGAQDNLLHQVLRLVDLKYVDSVHLSGLKSDAIKGILSHLDPHSAYIPPKEFTHVNEEMQGSFHGIGIAYFVIDDTVNITRVLPGGPAAKAGLSVGDQILKANDSLMAGVHISSEKIRKFIRGPLHSNVKLVLLRKDSLIQISLKRGRIPLTSIDAAYMIAPGVLYVKINRFSAHTYGEFMDAITALKAKHDVKKCILDLRNNPGGYLEASVNIADEFLSGDKLVAEAKGKSYPLKEFTCNKTGELEEVPLAVLVNGQSASASEILAGAIQDWDRGYIIGRQTFGKGLVQEQYQLANKGVLRLTVARYYLPSGRLIQRPYKDRMLAYSHDLIKRYRHGEMLHADSIHFQDTTAYYTKVKHRLVHAEAGIMPDVFVPLDTTSLSPTLMKIYRKNIIFRFAFTYKKKYPAVFENIKNEKELLQTKIMTKQGLNLLYELAKDEGITGINRLSPSEIQTLQLQTKAFIARERWQDKGYFEVINQEDKTIKKALQVLQKEPDLSTLNPEKPSAHKD